MPRPEDQIDRQEFRRAATELGLAALRVALLINGGAAVAILAFLGSALQSDNFKTLVPYAATSLGIFSIGLFLAAMAAFCGWRSQDNLAQRDANIDRGNNWLRAAGCFFVLSVIAFPVGSTVFCWSLIAVV